ncbi:hypothetical protein HZS_6107 [Henneguya salminicola]|nr:hypothetical protein HZS_6107 [Henneguya salminicola]
MDLNVQKTIYRGNTISFERSKHMLHWLGYDCDGSFPIVYSLSEQHADHTMFDLDFTIFDKLYSVDRVNILLRGSIPDTEVYIKGYRHSGFRFKVRITHNQQFQIREDRYNLVECGQRCGTALFVNYTEMSKICIQAGPKLYYLNLEQFDDSFDLRRSLFMGLSTPYYRNIKYPLMSWRVFLARPCSDEEIKSRNITSNLSLIVDHFQTVY